MSAGAAPPTFLVTGATGFLGRHVLRAIRTAGHTAAVLVRQKNGWLSQDWRAEAGDVHVVEGTPLNLDHWQFDPVLTSVTTIIHTAAMVKHSRVSPAEMMEFNVGGTSQMVLLAQRLNARLVFVSTSGTVGCYHFANMTADEDAPYAETVVGHWPYYASKIRAERESRRLADKLNVDLITVRPPVLLGPDDHRLRSTGYVQKVLEQKIPAIPSGGMHFTDIRDVATALVRIAAIAAPRDIYHLPGCNCSLAEFIAMITEISGVPSTTLRLPAFAALGLAKIGARLPKLPHWLPDPVVLEMSTCYWGLTSLFAHELGYAPRSARQTLSDTIEWLRGRDAHSQLEPS